MNGIIGLGDLVDRVSIINIKVYMLETIIKDETQPDNKVAESARMVRKLCRERMVIKNLLNKWSGLGFEDMKTDDLKIIDSIKKAS